MQQWADWLASPLGQYLLSVEAHWFCHTMENQYGYTAIQLGTTQVNLLATCKIRQRILAGQGLGVHVVADPLNMPFASSSVDVLVLPHVLDFCADPHQVLREAQRVLVPEGRILISGFNPFSLWGARRWLGKRNIPWAGNFIRLPRVKDWLSLLNFRIRTSAMGAYIPPAKQRQWQKRFLRLESAGDRWWPGLGAIYFLEATKQVYGMRLTGLLERNGLRQARPSRLKLVTGKHELPVARLMTGQFAQQDSTLGSDE